MKPQGERLGVLPHVPLSSILASSNADGLSSQPKVPLTTTTWEPNIGPPIIRDEMCTTQRPLHDYVECFAFNLKKLCQLYKHKVQIILENDNPIFRKPYRLNEVERAQFELNTRLVELFKGKYVLTIIMLSKKDIFDNWIECYMCGDYHLMNKQTHSNIHVMPLLEETFDTLGQAKVCITLDLRFGYHQLPLKEGEKVKMRF